LWLAKGNTELAHGLLAPIYRNFSKDLYSPDLKAAATVLEAH
jgi:hypothetical protein